MRVQSALRGFTDSSSRRLGIHSSTRFGHCRGKLIRLGSLLHLPHPPPDHVLPHGHSLDVDDLLVLNEVGLGNDPQASPLEVRGRNFGLTSVVALWSLGKDRHLVKEVWFDGIFSQVFHGTPLTAVGCSLLLLLELDLLLFGFVSCCYGSRLLSLYDLGVD